MCDWGTTLPHFVSLENPELDVFCSFYELMG